MTPNQTTALRDFIAPSLIALLVGTSSSWFTMQKAIATLETRVNIFERDLINIDEVAKTVRTNNTELAARGQWMSNTDGQLKSIIDQLTEIQKTNYTNQDAAKDITMIMREIDLRHESEND